MPDAEVARQVKNTFTHEWTRAHRVTRTFTALGFNKGRLPMDLWTSMKTYYYNNANNLAREEWNDKGCVCVCVCVCGVCVCSVCYAPVLS